MTATREGQFGTQVQKGSAFVIRPEIGVFKHAGVEPTRHVREFRVDDVAEFEIGQTLDISMFSEGDVVSVVGTSKGKGFAGTIKRHHFSRGPETHGSDSHRAPGSIGGGTG